MTRLEIVAVVVGMLCQVLSAPLIGVYKIRTKLDSKTRVIGTCGRYALSREKYAIGVVGWPGGWMVDPLYTTEMKK